MFSGELGERLYKKAADFIEKLSMKESIMNGVLVGFSGGPDSVFLLEFLNEYRKRCGEFKILAVHVNHSIRGEEADFDERFSHEYARMLNVEFISKKLDVPRLAEVRGESIEEAARNARYSFFAEIIRGRNDVSTIAVAHNANDNFETVLFNMMRGSGLRGISGIAPLRDNIIRPILEITKSEILELFSEKGIQYAKDSTNLSTEYTRNYIRHELIPRFSRLSPSPEGMITKLSDALRQDNEYIENEARKFYNENAILGRISLEKLNALHNSLKTRVISCLAEPYGISLERVHISNIIDLIPKGNFKLSLPKGYEFVSESGECYIDFPKENEEFCIKLALGENKIEGFEDIVVVSENKIEDSFSNVYKISIQGSFNFDIINTELFIRSKKDGDSYRFGGMTRKLKKLFNDKDIPPSRREDVPVLCDNDGILWIPGFKIRDGARGDKLYVAICTPYEKTSDKKRSFYVFNNIFKA